MSQILAIDDNRDNLVTVTAQLKLFIPDCDIITAQSGEQGIQLAIDNQPDTILLDVHMPGIDGFETCKLLKAHAETAHIPVIILTAIRTDSKSRVKALELGADAFLSKPIDESELAAQVKAMLRIKHAEDKLRNEKGHLEELVAKRVKDLSISNKQLLQEMEEKLQLEKRLIQAQKMEAIGNLAGGIAHDFNNILSSILGFTELALDDVAEGSPIKDNLEEVYIAGNRAKELVQQILAFSRQSEELKKPVKLNETVIEALKLLRPSTPTSIEIIPTISSIETIRGNVSQLHQIVMNLCTNAIHSLEEKGGVLEIALKDVLCESDPGSVNSGLLASKYVELTVTDNGPGIDPAIIDNIFEPYFTTKGVGEGTGMGLSMVQGIVESHGGSIQVESEMDQKTVFTIRLPLEAGEKAGEKLSVIDQIDQPAAKGTESILFVDDEPPIARMGSRMLNGLGYKVKSQTSSLEALELFKINPDAFDMVITDMTMPAMTGDILAKEIKKIRPGIPVILCTGYSNRINASTADGLGVNALADKPFIKANLANMIRQVLDVSLE